MSVDKSDIIKGLKSLGVKPGMALEVHSSLGSFGHVSGGAETVIDSLIECVGKEGSIVMPSFLLSKSLKLTPADIENGLTYKVKALDPNHSSPSCMGVIADTFKDRDDVLTGTGRHRVSAMGKDKEINSRGLHNLIANDQWALLIGVDIYRLTSMHYVEKHLPQEIRQEIQAPEKLYEIYPKEKWYIEAGVPKVRAWYKIQDMAFRNGNIKDAFIGKSKFMFFKINDVVGLYEKELIRDPFGLYGVEKP